MKDSKRIRQPSCRRIVWVSFTNMVTFLIPNALLNLLVRREAWKEKVAIFVLCLMIVATFYVWLELIIALFCNPSKTYSYSEVYSNKSDYSSVKGQVLDWKKYGNSSEMTTTVNLYPHLDLSPLFPTFMLLKRPSGQSYYEDSTIEKCINGFNRSTQADKWLQYKMKNDLGYHFENNQLVTCPLPNRRNQTGAPCFFSSQDIRQYDAYPKKGSIRFSKSYIKKNGVSLSYTDMSSGRAYVIMDNKVLDLTDYFHSATTVVKIAKGAYSRALAIDRMFLPVNLTVLLFLNLGSDITTLLQDTVPNPSIYQDCLDTLFYHGLVDGNTQDGCARVNVGLWITLGLFFLFFLIKMHMANLTQFRCIQRLMFHEHPPLTHIPHTLLFVPFYAEPSEIIRQTLDALARTSYPDTHKLLFFVCDGITQSPSDTKANYLCLLDALGYSSTRDSELRAYQSLGSTNYARVYAGFYESGRNRVPFMVVVKVGSQNGGGNRGKRDSMLIALGFLERCLNLAHHVFSPLEFELYNQCYHLLGLDPRLFKYMLVTDADIQVQGNVVHRLVSRLEADPKTLALSGYIRPANPEENVITMLQIFPVYMTYYSGLAYEACMGGLMTLNGGFAMYRIWTEDLAWPKVNEEVVSSKKKSFVNQRSDSSSEDEEEERQESPETLSLQPNPRIRPISIHPTVLRGLAIRADTLHMENILLLGEEQYLSLVLLQSHPGHRLGFDPESTAYTTLPTHFFTLQGLYTRTLRASLHIQVEFLHLARHLGVMYWIASLTKLLDTVFSVPIMIYLYNILISYFVNKDQAFGTIAGFFLGLIVLHIIYLFVHRQFKYIFWFVLYCLFGIPLFHIYFPVWAAWCSDDSHRWYDVWPTGNKKRHRLHGIIEQDYHGPQEEIHRMQLADFERQEAEKNALREREHAEMLDAKFNGFTGYVGQVIAYPAAVQIRRQHHKRYGSGESRRTGSSTLENPFEESRAETLISAKHTIPSSDHTTIIQDTDQYSLSNSILSLESIQINEEMLEGRNTPLHSKLASYL
ncbi:hypothetical protein G6F56_002250 [Rhizopus delemar]|nr:hypothetical protein G6F56_002250 [Rhizopus delemar]